MPRTRQRGNARATIPLSNYLRSELTRAHGSALQWLPLLSLPLALLTFILARVTGSGGAERSSVLLWQAIFVTGLLAPLAAVFASTAEAREKAAHGGGISYRGVSSYRLRLARFVVVATSIGAFCLINFGLSALAACGEAPRILLIGAVCWLAMSAMAGFSAAAARRWGTVPALVAAVVWQGLSIIPSVVEGPRWWILPMAWPMRLLLPLIGVHTNSTPLEEDATLATADAWAPLLLCLLLGVSGACSAIFASPRHPHSSRRTRASQTTDLCLVPAVLRRAEAGPRYPLRALAPVILHPGVRACLVLAAILSGAIAWIYPTKYVQGWCVFGLFPLGAGLLAVLVWPVLKPAWGLLRTEYPHITQSVLILCALIVAAVVCMGWLLGLSSPGAVMALATTLCFFLAAVLCMVKWGAAVTLALSIILTIFSATIGGDVLADSALWILAMPAWPEIATSAARFPIALVLSIAMSAAAWIGASTLLPKLLTR